MITAASPDRPGTGAAAPADADATLRNVLAVAEAMLHLCLPHMTSGLCLWAVQSQDGTRLHATHAAGGTAASRGIGGQQTAAALMVIDSLAIRWGHSGDENAQTLWAVI